MVQGRDLQPFQRNEPWHRLEGMRRDLMAMVDAMTPWGGTTDRRHPSIDIYEDGDELVVEAEVPGVEPQDLAVEVDEEMVSLRGRTRYDRSTEENGYYRRERRVGTIQRRIRLPAPIDPEQARAHFRRGVLTIRAPRQQGRGRLLSIEHRHEPQQNQPLTRPEPQARDRQPQDDAGQHRYNDPQRRHDGTQRRHRQTPGPEYRPNP